MSKVLKIFVLPLFLFCFSVFCQNDALNDTDVDVSDKSKRQSFTYLTLLPSNQELMENHYNLTRILPDILSKQSNIENDDWKEASNSLRLLIDSSVFEATICGHKVLPYREFLILHSKPKKYNLEGDDRSATFMGFLDFERRRYRNSDVIPELIPTRDDKGWVLIVTLTLNSSMHFQSVERFHVRIGRNFLSSDDSSDWSIKSIELDGACLNSQNFDRKYVIDMWQAKREPGNVTAAQFVEFVNDLIPFTNKLDQKHFDRKFIGFIDTASNINQKYNSNEFKAYMIRLMKRYKHRIDLKVLPMSRDFIDVAREENEDIKAVTNIITQQKDHVVFRTSTIFQSIKDEYLFELWDFQIEAILNSENQWKIVKIFLRPPMYYIGNDIMETEILISFVERVREGVEKNMKNGTFPDLYIDSKVKNITFCNEDHRTKRFDEFTQLNNATLTYCRDEIITMFPNINFNIDCFFKTNDGKKVIQTNYRATFDIKREKFNVYQIDVFCPALIG